MRNAARPHRSAVVLFAPFLVAGLGLAAPMTAAGQVFIATDEVMVVPDPTLVDKLYLAFRNNPPGWFFVHHPFLTLLVTAAVVGWAMHRVRQSEDEATFDPVAAGVTPGWEPASSITSDVPVWRAVEESARVPQRLKPIEIGDANPVERPAWMTDRPTASSRHA